MKLVTSRRSATILAAAAAASLTSPHAAFSLEESRTIVSGIITADEDLSTTRGNDAALYVTLHAQHQRAVSLLARCLRWRRNGTLDQLRFRIHTPLNRLVISHRSTPTCLEKNGIVKTFSLLPGWTWMVWLQLEARMTL